MTKPSTKTKPKIFIVTPIHNGRDHTLAFLRSIHVMPYPDVSTIIIDDGSDDGSAEAIRKQFSNVIVLSGDGNLWWSGSTNLGVNEAIKQGADFIFTVNNDVKLRPDIFDRLIESAEESAHSLIGSHIVHMDDEQRTWYLGAGFDEKSGDVVHYLDVPDTRLRSSQWLTGMGVLIPVSVFKDIGLYDAEHFPQYFGDADLSLRAHRAGYKLLVDRDAKLSADISSSWIGREPNLSVTSFLKTSLWHIRSQYNIRVRTNFYRRYWPGNWRLALLKFYKTFCVTMAWPLIRTKVGRLVRGKR